MTSDRAGSDRSETASYGRVLTSRWVLVSVATLLYWTGAHGLRPLLPLRLDALGANEFLVGSIIALFPLASLGLAIPGGRLVDRIGVRRVLMFGLIGMALLGAGFSVAPSPLIIAGLVVGIGVMELAAWLSLQALASVGGTGSFLTRQLAVFSLAWGAGIAVGPIIGASLYDRFGFFGVGSMYFGCAAIATVCVLSAPRVVNASPRGQQRVSMRTGVATMWAYAPVKATLLSSFVTLFVLGIKGSFLPLYLERAGLSVPRIGVVLSALGIASLVIRLPLPRLLEKFGSGRILVFSMWLALVPMTLMPFVTGFGWWLTLAVVCGAGVGINPPVTVELMARHTDVTERGLAMGLRLTANRVAQVIQPVLFGSLVSLVGFAAAFTTAGVLLVGVTGWTQRVKRQMREVL